MNPATNAGGVTFAIHRIKRLVGHSGCKIKSTKLNVTIRRHAPTMIRPATLFAIFHMSGDERVFGVRNPYRPFGGTRPNAIGVKINSRRNGKPNPTRNRIWANYTSMKHVLRTCSSNSRTTRRGMRHTTVRYAISAVRSGPKWPRSACGNSARVSFPQSAHTAFWQRYSVMCASIRGSSVT